MTVREQPAKALGTAAVYAAGAALYYLTVERQGVTFLVTPLFMGAIMLVAAFFRPRLLASAVLLAAWGAAVLLIHAGKIPSDRSAPAYMFAFGVGAAVLLAAGRWIAPRVALETTAIVLLVGGAALYGAFDIGPLGDGWFWALVLLINAIGLVLVQEWKHLRAQAPQTERRDGPPTVA